MPGAAQARGTARAASLIVDDGTHSDDQPHSPNILSAGDCHVEAQLGKDGRIELFIYGQKERQLHPISYVGPAFVLEAKAMFPGELGIPVEMTASPYSNEPAGTSSRFVGQVDRRVGLEQMALYLTISLEGKNYLLRWFPKNLMPAAPAPPRTAAAPDPAMPQAVPATTAKSLFLSPGGKYTAQDVAANGRTTAVQKYGSQMSMHNAHPKPGDRICPITDTVANPKFSWVVSGKKYLFCCPPCIEEFVKQAKEKPDSIKEPMAYRKPVKAPPRGK
jgi:YHS domain-containing protein